MIVINNRNKTMIIEIVILKLIINGYILSIRKPFSHRHRPRLLSMNSLSKN